MAAAHRPTRRGASVVAAAAGILSLSNGLAVGADRYYVGPASATWSNTSFWSATSGGAGGASIPGFADIAHIENSDAVSRNITLDTSITVNTLDLGNSGSLAVNSLTQAGAGGGSFGTMFEYVGSTASSHGLHTHSAGLGSFGALLSVGAGTNSTAAYNLSGNSSVLVTGPNSVGIYVGASGSGTFNQSSGTVTVGDDSRNATLSLGFGGDVLGTTAGGNGTYLLSGTGTLRVIGNDSVGHFSNGTFIQNGGTHVVGTPLSPINLVIGTDGLGARGNYLLNDGLLQSPYVIVGGLGKGTFSQAGGTSSIGYELDVSGNSATGAGTYLFSGGSLTSGFREIVGFSAGVGTFIQNGGTNTITGAGMFAYLVVGHEFDATGNYQLINGTLAVNPDEHIGLRGVGTFDQSGGSNTVGTVASLANLILGVESGSRGTYKLSGTASLVVNGDVQIGADGTGSMLQSGGSASISGTTFIRRNAGGSGVYNLSGGTLAAHDIMNNGSFTQSGTSSAAAGNFDNSIDGAGSVAVSGGSLTLNRIRQTSLSISGPAAPKGFVQVNPNGGPAATSRLRTLLITGGKLDLTNNDLIIDYNAPTSPLSNIRAMIIAGYHGGDWQGDGMVSSKAATSPNPGETGKTTLAYGEASALGLTSFSGQSVDSTCVLVKYTYFGDADLDGDTDGVDIGAWAVNFTGELGGTGTKVWTEGDWDYDGDVDGVDAGLWAQSFTGELGGAGLGAIVVSSPISPGAAAILAGMGVRVVPEPPVLALLGTTALMGGLTAGRRKRQSMQKRLCPASKLW